MEATLANRLDSLLANLGTSAMQLGNAAGIAPKTLYTIIDGTSTPSFIVLERLGKTYPFLNLHWLITGQGEMFLSTPPTIERRKPGRPKAVKPENLESLEAERIIS